MASAFILNPAERVPLEALLTTETSRGRLSRPVGVVLATVNGRDINEIMQRAATSEPTVWRSQERYLHEGMGGIRCDKIHPLEPQRDGLNRISSSRAARIWAEADSNRT